VLPSIPANSFFFLSLPSHFVATFPEAVQSEELYLAEQPRLRGNETQTEEKKKLFSLSVLFALIEIYEGDGALTKKRPHFDRVIAR